MQRPGETASALSDKSDLSDSAEASGEDRPAEDTLGDDLPSHRRAIVVLAVVAVLAVAIDLISKQLAVAHLRDGQPVRWLGGAVYLVLIRNSGAAFSFGTGHTWVFPVITIVVIAAIIWAGRTLRSVPWAVAFGLVLGGALGNLGDRLFRAPGPMRGEVVDFVSLFSNDGHGFAIFNLADSALCCGVALAILLELMGRRRDGISVKSAAPQADNTDSARLTG
jgi:signal peptidase II